MRSLEARISTLEQRKPAPNVVFVAMYRPGGSLLSLGDRQVYGRRVALLAEPSRTVEEWTERYVGRTWKELQADMERATANLMKHSRQRDGNRSLAG